MTPALTSPVVAAPAAPARRQVVPSAVLGMLIWVVAEVMYFSGLMSALTIARASSAQSLWASGVTLPVQAALLGLGLLLTSGAALLGANALFKRGHAATKWAVLGAWVLGLGFLAVQGSAWAGLRAQGMTLTSSALSSFYYLIVGGHLVHAVLALLALGFSTLRALTGKLSAGTFFGTQVFWYFVVLMWPVITARVYF